MCEFLRAWFVYANSRLGARPMVVSCPDEARPVHVQWVGCRRKPLMCSNMRCFLYVFDRACNSWLRIWRQSTSKNIRVKRTSTTRQVDSRTATSTLITAHHTLCGLYTNTIIVSVCSDLHTHTHTHTHVHIDDIDARDLKRLQVEPHHALKFLRHNRGHFNNAYNHMVGSVCLQ